MKLHSTKLLAIATFSLCVLSSFAQVVDFESINDAVLMPRVDTLPLIANAQEGMIVYQKSEPRGFYVHDGNEWKLLKSAHTAPTRIQVVLLGFSNATGEAAAQAASLIITNASVVGCTAISVGGYATFAQTGEFGGNLEYGVPVLLDCPAGTMLNPNGTPQ